MEMDGNWTHIAKISWIDLDYLEDQSVKIIKHIVSLHTNLHK